MPSRRRLAVNRSVAAAVVKLSEGFKRGVGDGFGFYWLITFIALPLLPFVALLGTGLTVLFLQLVSALAYDYL
jgi:hypothetical protein